MFGFQLCLFTLLKFFLFKGGVVVTLLNSKYDDTKILQFKDYAKILEVQRPMTFVMKMCGFSSLSRSGAPKFVSAFSDCIGCRLQAE